MCSFQTWGGYLFEKRSTMWDLGNRAAVVLISLTCGCLLIYNAWGAILGLALTLLLVVYACYSLLANDSLVSPHAYRTLGYLSEARRELAAASRVLCHHGVGQVRKLGQSASRYYREHFPFRMPKRRASAYQLSSDPYVAVKSRRDSTPSSTSSLSASRFGSIDQLSPIPRVPHRLPADDRLAVDGRFYDVGDSDRLSQQQQQAAFGKHTSTPVLKPGDREETFRNGDVDPDSRRVSSRKVSSANAQTCENIAQFSPEGSPWGVSISPAMRPRPAGVKTVQTVAGPLLASTRYNIDPKVYTDVTSPGLTTRLTKYATEAKSTLIHQSQYGTGQFPKVNLYASPIPLLNAKSTKMRMPVTVRVAAPDVAKYSPPERQKILSNICHTEDRSPTSVVQVLREISLKRHASTDDVSFDVAKKQKTDSFFNEERELILEENNKQKRGRDESSKSEEDFSPQNKSARATKRTKTQSCYDILNSLSSSMNVSTGVKRKAVDFSRSGTPDFEKHFKSLESTHPPSNAALQSQNLEGHTDKAELKEIYSRNLETLNSNKMEEFPLMKGILKSSNRELKTNLNKAVSAVTHKATKKVATETNDAKSVSPSRLCQSSVRLTEKLFMRAEPERNEQLKSLVEEPSNIKVKFATDNVEEIKKEDIRNMRRTNMKARLQSMFDAISGKAENKINPDVVIQADDINAITPPITCSVICATLNSSTTTTNINTTPLSTAAIVPSGFSSSSLDAKLNTKPATIFSSPNTTPNATLSTTPNTTSTLIPNTTVQSNMPPISIPETKGTIGQAKVIPIMPVIVNTESLQKTVSSAPSTASTFTFGKPKTTITTSSSSLPNFGTTSISNSSTFALATTTPTSSSTSINFLALDKTPLSSAFTSVNPSAATNMNIQTNNTSITTSATLGSSAAIKTTQASPTFNFGGGKSFSSPATMAQTTTSSLSSPGMMILPVKTTAASIINATTSGFNSTANTLNSPATAISTAPPLFAFGSNGTVSQLPKSNTFAFGQSDSNIQSKVNAFGSPSSGQTTSLSQATTQPFNFASNISAVTTAASNSFTNTTDTTSLVTPISISGLSSTPAFSLTSTTSSTSTPSTSKSLFTFGSSNTSNATSTAAVLPVTTASSTNHFGAMKNNAVLAFGASTKSVTPQFSTSTLAVPQFGVSTTSIFATTSNTTTSTNIFGSTSNSQSFFGTASAVPTGTTGIFNSPTTTVPSIFVTTTNTTPSSNSTIGSSLFASTTNANLTSTTTAPLMFGSGTPIFGQTKLSPSFGTAGGMTSPFGSTSPLFTSTTQASTPTASTFNIGNVSTGTPGFGGTSNATPAFGTSSVGTSQATSGFGGSASIFGSTDKNTSVPIFGTNSTPASGAFGPPSTTSTFGAQNPTSLNTFGSAASGGITTFGDNNKSPFATSATTAGFAGTSTSSSIPAFGTNNANNASNNTNAMFVFGSNQNKDGQQNTGFPFGSNFNAGNNNSTAASSAPFQFGSTSAKSATGFNFTTPQSTTPALNFGTPAAQPSTFNPSTPGMFNIGSGSTAPRSRTIRTRKPR